MHYDQSTHLDELVLGVLVYVGALAHEEAGGDVVGVHLGEVHGELHHVHPAGGRHRAGALLGINLGGRRDYLTLSVPLLHIKYLHQVPLLTENYGIERVK